jgi:hypothetical protein
MKVRSILASMLVISCAYTHAHQPEKLTADQLSGVWTTERASGYHHLECGINNLYNKNDSDTITCRLYHSRFDSDTFYLSNSFISPKKVQAGDLSSSIVDFETNNELLTEDATYKFQTVTDEYGNPYLQATVEKEDGKETTSVFKRVDWAEAQASFLRPSKNQKAVENELQERNIHCEDSSLFFHDTERVSIYKMKASNCSDSEGSQVDVKLKMNISTQEILKVKIKNHK